MRRKMIEADLVECVIGLGPNLFYNSPMEACVVICRTQKPKERRGRILFINALNEVTRERAQSFLTEAHQLRVVDAYRTFKNEAGFAAAVPIEEIRAKDGNLSIPLWVANDTRPPKPSPSGGTEGDLPEVLSAWMQSSKDVRKALASLLNKSE